MAEWTAAGDWVYPLSPNAATVEEWIDRLNSLAAALHDEPADDLASARL